MTNPDQRPDVPGHEVDDEMDLLFGRGNPNPTRSGCLSADVLRALSRKERPITDPGYEHLAQCSPCYREVRGFQQADARARAAAARVQRRWLLVAAAVILVVGVRSWVTLQRIARPSTTASAPQTVRLDLRPYSVTRGVGHSAEPEAVVLPRGLVRATILLPVGAEPGEYELSLLDQDQAVRASSVGTAAIRDDVTTLDATIDGSALAPGSYQLGIRHAGSDWRQFPVAVR